MFLSFVYLFYLPKSFTHLSKSFAFTQISIPISFAFTDFITIPSSTNLISKSTSYYMYSFTVSALAFRHLNHHFTSFNLTIENTSIQFMATNGAFILNYKAFFTHINHFPLSYYNFLVYVYYN